jgi:DNA-binding MarR family transcriptional regulator
MRRSAVRFRAPAPEYHPRIASPTEEADSARSTWTFFTTHGLVLLAIAKDPRVRLRDIVDQVGITDRAVRRIIDDLVREGYVSRSRVGRRNVYVVHDRKHLRHPMERHQQVRSMLAGLIPSSPDRDRRKALRSGK